MNPRNLLTKRQVLWALAAGALSAAVCTAQTVELRGTVSSLENEAKVPRSGLSLQLAGTRTMAETDAEGHFRIPLPNAVRPGEVVALEIASEGWYIDRPWHGKVLLGPDGGDVEVLVTDAPPADLWDAERLEGFFADFLTISARVAIWRDPPSFIWEIDQWLGRHGRPGDEPYDLKVEAWVAEAQAGDDPGRQGLADFKAGKLDDAVRHLGEAADRRLAELSSASEEGPSAEQRRQAIRALELQAGALYRAADFGAAEAVLRQALGYVQREEMPRRWAELSYRLALVLHSNGHSAQGDSAAKHVREAIGIYGEVLAVRTRDVFPDAWTETRDAMASALADAGDLDAAVLAYEEVLAAEPDYHAAAHDLVWLYHNRLGDSAKAFKVMGDWLNGHPGDAIGRVVLVELFFAIGRWDVCQMMSEPLIDATRDSPDLQQYAIALYAYNMASLLVLDDPAEALVVIDEARQELSKFEASFSLEWDFAGTLRTVRETDDLPYRDTIVTIFEVMSAGERDRIVAGLDKLAGSLAAVVPDAEVPAAEVPAVEVPESVP